MGAVAFNTYEFIKSLTDARMDEEQAAAISAGILRAHEVANLATKADVDSTVFALRSEMRESLAQTDAKIDKVEMTLRSDMRELQIQTKADLRDLERRMTIKLGSMMIVAVGVLAAVIKFL